ncbi:hypothetical protein DFH08DRAFT_978092 [Mycena albidolilacea]|uniref:Uncharacterized protein n=1 Tax=Mycena albidolilacea TaxID=1033008 RepID=A0AAD7E8I7_9AGAR|nr:hypothetical protein DFH08DRAFT_978092 [Mycena albidolilacea]
MTARGAVFFRHQAPDVSVVSEGDEHDDLTQRRMALRTRISLSIVRLFTWYCVAAAFLFANSHTAPLALILDVPHLFLRHYVALRNSSER